ncbi:MAG TPA: hypothetical protein VJ840_07410 [Gemmatimonadaceae bacterium]|nr:hypothetical protein [Gemmatimonadaceae bacterium]
MKARSLLPLFYSMLPAGIASAQLPLHLSFGGGLTPAYQNDGAASRGYSGSHLQYALEFTPENTHWGLRLDAFSHHMSRKPYPTLSSQTKILGSDFSVLYSFGSPARAWTPYLIAGAGTYRTEYGEPTPEFHFGIAGGAGLRFRTGPFSLLLESRVHSIADGSTPYLIPVTIGLRF